MAADDEAAACAAGSERGAMAADDEEAIAERCAATANGNAERRDSPCHMHLPQRPTDVTSACLLTFHSERALHKKSQQQGPYELTNEDKNHARDQTTK
jgi:hypothetical protein